MSNFKGWILDAIPRESAIAARVPIKVNYLAVNRRQLLRLGYLRNYFFPRIGADNFFIHHRTFLLVDAKRNLKQSRNRIWLTHFDDLTDLNQLFLRRNYIDRLFVQNSYILELLLTKGFERSKISLQPGAIDRFKFFPSPVVDRGNNYLLITGDCKPRKNPLFIQWLIRNFPDLNFIIHGNGWKEFEDGSLRLLPNLTIFEFDFGRQDEFLRNAIGLLILSTLEGGPVSLLESLACGTPVISTDVGFAGDILDESRGIIVKLEKSIEYWNGVFHLITDIKIASGHMDLLGGLYSWEDLGNEFYVL